ncbi:MAG: penicillin-binding protein activator LpoB [Bacteroidales bacterium]|nr:penicillin-binding protein activator LpoB [Bacteroidales bacterium]MBP5765258.1 penicillin-binding protein activator LpoB [Bacteroidales bacterium]
MKKVVISFLMLLLSVPSFAQRNVETVENNLVTAEKSDAKVIKRKVAIGRFSNETQYAKGVFYDKENDPMGKQALDILSSKLAASGKFMLLERNDLAQLLEECQKGDATASTIGADYMIIGSVTEFGRKNIGKQGAFTSAVTQVVEAAVAIRLVEVSTGLIIYSDEAKGSAEQTAKQTMGIGSKASYDATLSDKAISEAIGQLVENIINKCTDKPWRTYFLNYDADAILIAGGSSQGVAAGDQFFIKTKGKKVKNPQTGVTIELPGKQIGTVKVLATAGDTPETEYSFVEVQSEIEINSNNMSIFIIEEK